jgi:hypothetical protein
VAGGGILTLAAMLLMIPFQLWQEHAQNVRSLSPHELNLRRASQPPAFAAVTLFYVWHFNLGDDIANIIATPAAEPAANWPMFAVPTCVLFYSMASFITGACRSWGVRSEGMLPVRAFLKLITGIGGLIWLNSETRAGGDFWLALLWLVLFTVSIWCVVIGAVRLLLLTVGGGSPLVQVQRHIRQTRIVMRPARSRPWWRFW